MKCGYGHYVRLMENFNIVVDVFLGLDDGFQDVIADITRRMGEGMAKYITLEVGALCCPSAAAQDELADTAQRSVPLIAR